MTDRELADLAYGALGRNDLEAFLSVIDPDVEFTSLVAEAEGSEFHGHAGVTEWWTDMRDTLGGLGWDVEDLQEMGEGRILVRLRITGDFGGNPISQTMFQLAERRGNLVFRWRAYRTEAEALDALAQLQ